MTWPCVVWLVNVTQKNGDHRSVYNYVAFPVDPKSLDKHRTSQRKSAVSINWLNLSHDEMYWVCAFVCPPSELCSIDWRYVHPLPSNRQHLSYDVCLEVRGSGRSRGEDEGDASPPTSRSQEWGVEWTAVCVGCCCSTELISEMGQWWEGGDMGIALWAHWKARHWTSYYSVNWTFFR